MSTLLEIEVSSFDNVFIEIYTIGFPQEGESILSVLKDGDKILLSFLMDSYKIGNVVPVLNIAKQIQLEHLDWFFWTHPDEDHSVGIEETLQTLDGTHQTQICLPSGLNKNLSLSQVARSALDFIMKNYNSGTKYSKAEFISTAEKWGLPSWSINFKEQISEREMPCKFTMLAPNSSVVQRLDFSDKPRFNDFSLVLSVSWNTYTFLYTGDIPNRGIRLLNENNLRNILYLKIPHHGSSSSNNMVNRILFKGTGEERAVSTINKTNNLPENDVLQSYKEKINPNNVIVVGGKEDKAEICCLKYRLVDSQCQERTFYI